MASLAREASVDLVLMIFPMPKVKSWKDYSLQEVHEKVAGAARRAGMEVIDLLEPFSRVEIDVLRFNAYDPHPNEEGHRVAAETLLEHLEQSASSRSEERHWMR